MCKCAQLQIVGKVKFAHIDKYACIGKYERHNLFSSVPSYDAARLGLSKVANLINPLRS